MSATPSQRGDQPFATVIPYGPDNRTATKLVLGIYKQPGQESPDPIHRWIKPDGGIRDDPTIAAEIAAVLEKEGIKECVHADRILGCPHEEGIDYPEGAVCPHCPFWANVDRFTHEPKSTQEFASVPSTSMTAEQVLAALSMETNEQPVTAIIAADELKSELVEPFLNAIERGLENPLGVSTEQGPLFSYATHLLAKWREVRVHPLLIRWLSLPDGGAFALGGDTVTESGGRMLAMTCGGSTESIKSLILNQDADEFGRGQAIKALACLAAWGDIEVAEIKSCFLWLAKEGLERTPSQAWHELADCCVSIQAHSVLPELQRAFDDQLIDELYLDKEELDSAFHAPQDQDIGLFLQTNPRITDVVEETSWWECFQSDTDELDFNDELEAEDDGRDDDQPSAISHPESVGPYMAPLKIGRNEPCPCGSGKKYKKCCG